MTWQDAVNGLFYEATGALWIGFSILRLHRDKVVRGVHVAQVLFFASWGWWNLYYYPHLGQWASFWGGLGIVLANGIWLGQVVYYTLAERLRNVEALDPGGDRRHPLHRLLGGRRAARRGAAAEPGAVRPRRADLDPPAAEQAAGPAAVVPEVDEHSAPEGAWKVPQDKWPLEGGWVR